MKNAGGTGSNAGKTCRRWHDYNAVNTYVCPKTGNRMCRVCRSIARRDSEARQGIFRNRRIVEPPKHSTESAVLLFRDELAKRLKRDAAKIQEARASGWMQRQISPTDYRMGNGYMIREAL